MNVSRNKLDQVRVEILRDQYNSNRRLTNRWSAAKEDILKESRHIHATSQPRWTSAVFFVSLRAIL